ncbi:MAG: HD domain-containing protein [Planctomycetes bacterium]|nr:HD domain-containing protein [Planctomycetota bacterium]
MLLCTVASLEPGMEMGGSIPHPRRPSTELLRPGVTLDARMINNLRRLGVTEVWVRHDATADLDVAVAPNLAVARMEVFNQLKKDFSRLSVASLSGAQLQSYRQTITDLVFELLSSGQYAHLSHQLLADPSHVFTHSANVAFLSVLVGLEMETYLVDQRPQLAPEHARDVVPLGLGAMLHDIGKAGMKQGPRQHHEIHAPMESGPDDPDALETYRDHVFRGRTMLDISRFPATARHAVLNHHQRFDGTGWPDQAVSTRGRHHGPQQSTDIHIFCRIIAAANVLDNLLNDRNRHNYPTVAALGDFNSKRFDGWFDPVVRYLMIRRLPPFPIGSLVLLSNSRKAVIVALNFRQPCRPVVRILDEACRNENGELPVLDLDTDHSVYILEAAGQRVDQYLFDLPNLRTGAGAAA